MSGDDGCDVAGRILVVDDDPDAVDLLGSALAPIGCEVEGATDVRAAIEVLGRTEIDVVVTDLRMGGESGLDLCRYVLERRPDLPVLLVTAHASLAVAIDAIRAGAFDFLTKPVQIEQLRHRVRGALKYHELVREARRLRRLGHDNIPARVDIVGESIPMKRAFELLSRLAASDTNVLITGETGVGKELFAHALHAEGSHAAGPFVAVNCAAVPPSLIESELFGHVRGAFTDAKRSREGLFVRADGGTLFLDEIGDLALQMQSKLLRALQERRVTPVGGDREIPFEVRIISATHRDLEREVAEGRFREDLFYRINVVRLDVPPLRARGSDVLLLAQYFLARAAERLGRGVKGLAPETAEKLLAYDWPGNVRELENAMEHGVALAELEELRIEDLPSTVRSHRRGTLVVAGSDPQDFTSLTSLGDRYIRHVLRTVGGNKTKAAEILGVGRRTLYRRLERSEEPEQTPIAHAAERHSKASSG